MQNQHGPVLVGQLGQRFINPLAEFAPLEPLRGIRRHHGHLSLDPAQFLVHLLNRLCPQSLLLPQLVEAEIDDDPRQPGHETGFALKLLQSLPGLHPGFLRKINGVFLISHHAESAAVDFVPMPGDEFLKSLHAALLRGFHQRFIVSRSEIEFLRHSLDVTSSAAIQSVQSLPLVLGTWLAIRASR